MQRSRDGRGTVADRKIGKLLCWREMRGKNKRGRKRGRKRGKRDGTKITHEEGQEK